MSSEHLNVCTKLDNYFLCVRYLILLSLLNTRCARKKNVFTLERNKRMRFEGHRVNYFEVNIKNATFILFIVHLNYRNDFELRSFYHCSQSSSAWSEHKVLSLLRYTNLRVILK